MAERARPTPADVLAALFAAPVVPVHAEADGARLIRLAEACHAGGVRAFEATDRLPGALEAFAALAAHRDRALPDLVLGVGSVEEPAVAAAYVAAGADFVVAPFVDDESTLRRCFSALRELASELGDRIEGRDLSMGMSNDYQFALDEGATMLRIGTALFGRAR
ncbi:MAG: hypothetical protein P1P87_08890 [Trueperaceae bacterium]|nr:hypothetical protein [Trueperaceae bacterium]